MRKISFSAFVVKPSFSAKHRFSVLCEKICLICEQEVILGKRHSSSFKAQLASPNHLLNWMHGTPQLKQRRSKPHNSEEILNLRPMFRFQPGNPSIYNKPRRISCRTSRERLGCVRLNQSTLPKFSSCNKGYTIIVRSFLFWKVSVQVRPRKPCLVQNNVHVW